MATTYSEQFQRANRGEERLWRIWWQWGIPLGLFANALTVLAEAFHDADWVGTGDAIDILKFLLFVAWFRVAWRCSKNTEHPLWTHLARLAICLGFGVTAITF
jgi:hypothetical protein